ncbi:MAG: GntR family transcriptional regulator [Micrococcales bacterium]|nr:GntR family transcriptional regulator [Micrococcales bacterium]
MPEQREALYLRVASDIRDQVESGQIAVGAYIPSVREIAERWDVSVTTATKAQAHLQSIGLVQAVPGHGMMVKARDLSSAVDLLRGAGAGLAGGHHAEGEILSSELVPAPADVAEALDVPEGAPVVRRERISRQKSSGTPVQTSVNWLPYPSTGAPALLSTDRIPQGTFTYLAEILGVRLAGGRQMLSAEAATALQAERLGLEEGTPVLVSREWFTSDQGVVLDYGESVAPPSQWVTYEFTA